MKILYLHGLGKSCKDELYNWITFGITSDIEIITIQLHARKPLETFLELQKIVALEKPEIGIGFSMGGFFLDLLPIPNKIYINPALLMPEYMSRKKGNDIVTEFENIAKEYRFKYTPQFSIDIVGNKDEKIGLASLETYKKVYGGEVILFDGGHNPKESDILEYVIPNLNKIITI